MNKINRIGGSDISISRIGTTAPSSQTQKFPSVTINESFTFPEIDLDEQSNNSVDTENDLYREILFQLFLDILADGVAIKPGNPKDHGSFVVEASFVAAKNPQSLPYIILPLRGVDTQLLPPKNALTIDKAMIRQYINKIIKSTNKKDILRLIIVAAHEYGHFLSAKRGNHDVQLKTALYLMHINQYDDKYVWQVFREECVAWKNALQKLVSYGFTYTTVFEQVKNHSLQVYFKTLRLKNASIDTYYKLSFLGDDFFKNSNSDYFTTKK